MKKITVLLLLVLAVALPSFAQMGTGPAMPSATAVPDKFPSITWMASPSTGVTYNAYRGVTAGGPKNRVNTTPITVLNYRDTSAAFGTLNFYQITAQRTSDGVESIPSNEVSGAALQGSPAPPTNVNLILAILIDIGKGIEFAAKWVVHFLA